MEKKSLQTPMFTGFPQLPELELNQQDLSFHLLKKPDLINIFR